MRFCLKRVQAQNPQETSAPTVSGSRRPNRPLSEPIRIAPTAGPALKITHYCAIIRPRMRTSTAAWIKV